MFKLLTRGLDALRDASLRYEADGSSGSTAVDDGKTVISQAGTTNNDQSDPTEGLDDLLKDKAAAKEYIVRLRKENADKRAKGKTSEAELDALRAEKAQRDAAKKKEDEEAMRKRGEHEKIIADRDGSIATLTAEKDTLSAQLAEYHKRDAEELTVTLKALTKEEIELIDMIDGKDVPKRLRLAKSLAGKKRSAPAAPDTPPSNGFGGNGAQTTEEFIAGIFKTGK